jgi:hypothetical protein
MALHNDGGVVFGSQEVSIDDRDESAQDYIAENITITDPSNWTVRKDENGSPNGQVGVDDVPTGSMTLQLADSSVKLPKKYAEFTLDEVGGDTATFIVSEVGQAFQQDGETKVNVSFRAKLAA